MNTRIAQLVLQHYGIFDAQVTFLGKSQNTTFRVESDTGDKFLLRFHAGIETTNNESQAVWRELPVIQSELLWLNAIAHDTELTAPRPIQNCLGEWVTNFESEELEDSIACSLLQWVEGEHLESEPKPEQVRQLGSLMAQLHQHSINWLLPSGFSRPAHDTEQLQSATAQLAGLVQNGTISAEDYQVFQKAAAQVQGFMLSCHKTHNNWGLIHADLHQGNYIFYGEQIRPIDFSRCGFGFYLYDIGEAIGSVDAPLRSYFFEGYTNLRELPSDYQSSVEALLNGATIENFAFHSTNPKEKEWLSRAVPYVVKHHFRPYLNGENFLFQS